MNQTKHMTRNNLGQYTNKKYKGILPLLIIMAIIGVILYFAGDNEPATVPVEDVTFTQEAVEDPRIAEYLASEEAKLQAQLHVYEEDRLTALETNKANLAEIEATYKASLKAETERHAKEMFKVNANLDSVRKQILTKPSLE